LNLVKRYNFFVEPGICIKRGSQSQKVTGKEETNKQTNKQTAQYTITAQMYPPLKAHKFKLEVRPQCSR
jgi:hypothetical protein